MPRLAPVPYCTKWLGSVSVGKKKTLNVHSVAQSAPFSAAAGPVVCVSVHKQNTLFSTVRT